MGEYLALPDGAGSFPQGFTDPVVLRSIARINCLTRTGLSPSMALLSSQVPLRRLILDGKVLQPRRSRNHAGLGCSPFARHYLGNHYCFLFLRVLRCFSSPGSLPKAYVFSQGMTPLHGAGFPHSEIHGSQLVCSSPRLIAAYHVLHRLPMPRHPPCALNCLNL